MERKNFLKILTAGSLGTATSGGSAGAILDRQAFAFVYGYIRAFIRILELEAETQRVLV